MRKACAGGLLAYRDAGGLYPAGPVAAQNADEQQHRQTHPHGQGAHHVAGFRLAVAAITQHEDAGHRECTEDANKGNCYEVFHDWELSAEPPHVVLSSRARSVVVALATVVGVATTLNLGAWQLRRAAQKIALQTARELRAELPALGAGDLARDLATAEPQHFRKVVLHGRWLPEHNVFLENRQMRDRVGFYLVTPLKLAGLRETVLVQRGWVPRDLRDRSLLPVVPTPPGEVEVVGHIAPPPARLYEFAAAERGVIRQNLDLAGFARETGLVLAPLSVQQDVSPATVGDGLLRYWPRAAADVQKHYGYAFQWFALGALMAGLYVWFQLIRPRLTRR